MTGEFEALRQRLALVIYREGGYCGDCEFDGWDSCEDCRYCTLRYADAIIADLGLERVPTLAISVTDEHIEGVPFSVHRKPGDPFCGDESICAQHEPVYRVGALSGRTDAEASS